MKADSDCLPEMAEGLLSVVLNQSVHMYISLRIHISMEHSLLSMAIVC